MSNSIIAADESPSILCHNCRMELPKPLDILTNNPHAKFEGLFGIRCTKCGTHNWACKVCGVSWESKRNNNRHGTSQHHTFMVEQERRSLALMHAQQVQASHQHHSEVRWVWFLQWRWLSWWFWWKQTKSTSWTKLTPFWADGQEFLTK